MNTLYLTLLFVGLALGFIAMWRGVERQHPDSPAHDRFGRELQAQPVSLLLPGAAGACTLGSVVGYLLTRYSSLPASGAFVTAALAGACGALAATLLVTRWAVPSALASPEDPRYVLQGTPAKALSRIGPDGTGEVSYQANGQLVTVRARSCDGTEIPADADVVIERLEDDVAFVESWSVVEGRI